MDITRNDKASRAINDLVETCKDGMKGYETAAESVDNPQIKAELSRFSQQRAQFANELQTQAYQMGFSPQPNNTLEGAALDVAGAVHRGWINLKSAVTGHDSKAVLNECENGDAAALKTYEQALMVENLPGNIKNVIEKQHSEILEAKNKITALKKTV
jgi:uncharacterized protein (TIGR02284 family)